MDWKSVPARHQFEKAKDVAAFANHIGGTLLLGAREVGGYLSAYVGLDPSETDAIRDGYSKAVAALCPILPLFDFEEYDLPGVPPRKIIAINVWPSLDLVGVRVTAHKPDAGYGGESFVYPIRSGTDAIYLNPGQLAMYMIPQVRRVAILLSRIPRGASVLLRLPSGMTPGRGAMYFDQEAAIDEVRVDENVVTFKKDGKPMRRVPLDRISTVYEDWDSDKNRTIWRILADFPR